MVFSTENLMEKWEIFERMREKRMGEMGRELERIKRGRGEIREMRGKAGAEKTRAKEERD